MKAREKENATTQAPFTIGIETIGCRLNQYESDGLIQQFVESGLYTPLEVQKGPDLVIINSCTVTEQADKRNHNMIRRILQKNPECSIVFTGCYAQTDPEKLTVPGISLIVSNQQKSSLYNIIGKLTDNHKNKLKMKQEIYPFPIQKSTSLSQEKKDIHGLHYEKRPIINDPFAYTHDGRVRPQGHTRAYIKIQDGCDKKCTYCKIPIARGRGVSRDAYEIIDHARYLENLGVPEIILTGVNLGWYRDTKNSLRFIGLLEKILNALQSTRLRLSSIEPCDVDAPLAQLSQHPLFCDFLHVPLQSGSSKILRSMRRSYSPYSFQKRIETIRHYNSEIFLGTDIIIGFPGETEEDFQATLKLCQSVEIAGIHAFRYSPRSRTPATNFSGQVPLAIIKQRMQRMQHFRYKRWSSYVHKQSGKIRSGIVEKKSSNGIVELLTDDYLRAICHTKKTKNDPQKGESIPIILHGKVYTEKELAGKNEKSYKVQASFQL